MSHFLTPHIALPHRAIFAAALAWAMSAACGLASVDSPEEAGVSVATSASATGMLFRRARIGTPWELVKQDEGVRAGEMLLGMPGAEIKAAKGAAGLVFMADLDGTSPYPIRETALILHDDPKVDLDFTLDRGRVVVANGKDTGAAHVRVRAWDHFWNLLLQEPGTRVGLELYGRWPPGSTFDPNRRPPDRPIADLTFIVLKGHAELNTEDKEFGLKAPPGPALMEWDSVDGLDDTPKLLERLPEWAQEGEPRTERGQARLAVLNQFRQAAAEKGPEAAIEEFLKSDNPGQRRFAINALAATDQLPRLAQLLIGAHDHETWDLAVRAIRHWLGRRPGQDQKLYEGLIKRGQFPPGQAETVVQLLHSFGDTQLAEPETYEALIDYLGHDRLAIRGLAYWHLYRLVPEGRKLGYNPLAPKEQRDQAIAEWRKLIPPGHLPPNVHHP